MRIVLLPAALYALLHGVGLLLPSYFWGVNLLAYYAPPVQVLCAILAVTALYIAWHPAYSESLDQKLDALLQRAAARFSTPLKWVLCLSVIPLCYAFKVDIHLMGDGQAWLAYLENAQRGFPREPPGWIRGFPLAGLDWIHPLEPLDFWLHQLLYRFGRSYWHWQAADAYTWSSCLWGTVYAWGIWKLSGLLELTRLSRYTLLLLLATSGQVQLFFGYVESYVSLAAACALYAWCALHALRGGSLAGPALTLSAAAALHLMALALAPSFCYLVWHRHEKLREALKNPRALALLFALGAPAITWAYLRFYADRHLPLYQASSPGEYALLSLPHAANLANEILLVAPFAFIWVLYAYARDTRWTPPMRFATWASCGSTALVAIHATDFGGRDWDLLSMPTLFLSLWGFLSLEQTSPASTRALRWGALPILLIHAALFIGTNANKERAIERVDHLLEYGPNQPLHFQYYYRGYYQLEVRSDPQQAIAFFARAAELAPPNQIGPDQITYRSSYLRLLGYAQASAGHLREAITTFATAYPPGELPVFSDRDDDFHYRWVVAYLELGRERLAHGDTKRATNLWQRAIAYSRHQLKITPAPRLQYALALSLDQLGRPREAAEALRAALAMDIRDPALRTTITTRLEQLH